MNRSDRSSNAIQPCNDWCLLAHNLTNKLAVIIGQCDLLSERMDQPADRNRMEIIRAAARWMADEINGHTHITIPGAQVETGLA